MSRGVLLLYLFATACLVGLGSAASAAEQGRLTGGIRYAIPDWFKQSFLEIAEDAAEAGEADRHVMLFMHLDECPYCEAVLRESLVESAYSAWLRERFDVIALNVRGDREVAYSAEVTASEKELAQLLKVQQTPAVIFLDAQNRQVMRADGYLTSEEFKRVLDYVDSKSYLRMDFASFVAQNASGPSYVFRPHPSFADLANLTMDGPLLVLFEDAWCHGCDLLHDTLLSDPEVNALLEKITVVRLDAESETPLVDPAGRNTTPRAWVRELGLNTRPAFVLIANGTERGRIKGVLRHWHFTTALRYLAERHYDAYATAREFSRAFRQQQLDAGMTLDLGRQ